MRLAMGGLVVGDGWDDCGGGEGTWGTLVSLHEEEVVLSNEVE
jgi:hypothetical protein